MSSVNDESHQVLSSKVNQDGTINRFEVFRNNFEGHYGEIGAGYIFNSSFQRAYLERGAECMLIFYIKFILLVKLRRMQVHYMAHYLVHARVV
jgi:hypothetical protein